VDGISSELLQDCHAVTFTPGHSSEFYSDCDIGLQIYIRGQTQKVVYIASQNDCSQRRIMCLSSFIPFQSSSGTLSAVLFGSDLLKNLNLHNVIIQNALKVCLFFMVPPACFDAQTELDLRFKLISTKNVLLISIYIASLIGDHR
jgi:hypothetical protein